MVNYTSKINVLYWNANSIANKIHELYYYLHLNHIHVACISETHLKDNHRLQIDPDYKLYRSDRSNVDKGGVAIFVHKSIVHQLLPALNTKYIENIGISLMVTNNESIHIHSIYVPGRGDNIEVNSHLINDIRKLTNKNVSFFVCGDYNAKNQYWNCNRSNLAGTLLYNELCKNKFFVEYPDEHTHIPSNAKNSPSTIDLVLTNKLHDISDLKISDLSSDHCAVIFQIDTSAKLDFRPKTYLDYANANWSKFQHFIHKNIEIVNIQDKLTEPKEIDAHIKLFTDIILEAQKIAVPRSICAQYKLNLPDDLVEIIKIKNVIKRKWHRTRDETIKAQFRLLERIIKERVNIIRNENWSHKLSTIKPNHTNIWKLSKFLKKHNNNIPTLKTDNGLIVTSEQKANIIADIFEKNHKNPLEANSPDFTSQIKNKVSELRQPLPPEESPIPTDFTEVTEIIRMLKNPKCPGQDQISNKLIKKLPRRGINYLVAIINACLRTNYFPIVWKDAKVVPLLKPGKKKSDPTSYRPISLLSSLSKILERIILCRLQHHIDEKNIIPKEQHGFRSNSSTTHQLHHIIKQAKEGLKSKMSTGLISLDIEKAFDRIWHDGLIAKMIDNKFPTSLVKITKSFLSDRTFKVICNGSTSTTRSFSSGVPQGAVLSPTLFNIYIADIPLSKFYETTMFADDTSFYRTALHHSTISYQLKTASRNIETFLTKWKITINKEKTAAVYITNRRKNELPSGPIEVFGTKVEWLHSVKLLGVLIDKKLTFKNHIDNVISKGNIAIRTIYPLINRKSRLNTQNKILLYKQTIRPILTYGFPSFQGIALAHVQRLQTLQNKTLKMILDRPWWESTEQIHAHAKIPRMIDYINKITINFNSKLVKL